MKTETPNDLAIEKLGRVTFLIEKALHGMLLFREHHELHLTHRALIDALIELDKAKKDILKAPK